MPALAAMVALAIACGGCSYKLGSWFGKNDDQTGSISPPAAAPIPIAAPVPLPDGDLVFARAAVQELATRDDQDMSLPWENPASGARGTVTPIAAAYTRDGFQCRDFLASYLRDGSESWLQVEACRVHQGKWQVGNPRPWKRT